ncbi:PaaI family thioesterase [Prescottella agglutinans]|uniref:Acyl-coenzyme A thioesterase THEM4 n=1 Tax=Prescottella agglutinans TaxID=1644129 RepID=A0A438BGN0_9NOCA|nr:PaaI family thioesterase [Prescottella agglutinans]RVW10193.1 PaaI family thioesterase [Prescottella agglutinans]
MSESVQSGVRSGDDVHEHHGGFPVFTPVQAGPNFAEFVESFRRLQDLAVSTHLPDGVAEQAIAQAAALADLLEPYQVEEGQQPAGFNSDLPGRGSLLLLPWIFERNGVEGVMGRGMFRMFHRGGNGAAHGGTIGLLFDDLLGMIVHEAGHPIARTGYLHVNYRKVTPIETELVIEGRVDRVEGRKIFCTAELRDLDGAVLADCEALMVQLLPGQP